MQINILKTLTEELAGANSGEIIEILFSKKNVNEFLIAKKMNITINQVRNILYKLSAEGLVSFIRKKDKKKGWYIYYWTLDIEKSLEKIRRELIKKIEKHRQELEIRKSKRFYVCKTCNIEVGEETALEHGFTCNECADVYALSENESQIKEIKSKIAKDEKKLNLINTELEELSEKKQKKAKKESKKKPEKKQKKAKKESKKKPEKKQKKAKKESKKK